MAAGIGEQATGVGGDSPSRHHSGVRDEVWQRLLY
jgi:hypothetical protein